MSSNILSLNIFHVARFEFSRSMTPPRIAIWLALAMFPIALMFGVRLLIPDEALDDGGRSVFGFASYLLIPHVCCQLGLMLWATPAVGGEVEGRTWVYLATRPTGRSVVLIGKYLNAIAWSIGGGLISTTGVAIVSAAAFAGELWWTMARLVVLSSIAYAALYLLIGVLVHRRSMVIAMVYTLVVEAFLGSLPATINRATISYRLRSLLFEWMPIGDIQSDLSATLSTDGAATQIVAILILTGAALLIAVIVCDTRQWPQHDEA